MVLDSIIRIATAMTIAAALTGQLPRITNEVRKAQVKLLRELKASSWGTPKLRASHAPERK